MEPVSHQLSWRSWSPRGFHLRVKQCGPLGRMGAAKVREGEGGQLGDAEALVLPRQELGGQVDLLVDQLDLIWERNLFI